MSPALRHCETCGAPIPRRAHGKEYESRRFCSRACVAARSVMHLQRSYEGSRPPPPVKLPYLKFLDPHEWKVPT